jgi:methenyltetrahydromethanopterin cyclohydrolase
MDSLNRMAIELVDEALEFVDELNVEAVELDAGATVMDFGVDADGGLEAGLLLAEVQTAGLASVQTAMGDVEGVPLPEVTLSTDKPALGLLCAQKAGWELAFDSGYDGLGSGPARALVAEEAEFEAVGYVDEFDLTVLTVESIDLPTDEVARHVADRAGVPESGVFLPTYALGSTAGSVTGAARAAELAAFRLFELGYDPLDLLSATGVAPVAPVSYDETEAMARTNDAVAYGGRVYLQVREDAAVFDQVPSTVGEEFGVPFAEVFERVDYDVSELPASTFGPAQVTVDVVDGPTYALGGTDEAVVAESFGLRG